MLLKVGNLILHPALFHDLLLLHGVQLLEQPSFLPLQLFFDIPHEGVHLVHGYGMLIPMICLVFHHCVAATFGTSKQCLGHPVLRH